MAHGSVLITGGCSPVVQAVAEGLRARGVPFVLTDHSEASAAGSPATPVVVCDLESDAATGELLLGVDHVVYAEPALVQPGDHDDDDWLDCCTRHLYNLLAAAAAAEVRRCTVLSSMAVFELYSEALAVQPYWEPRPSCQPNSLGPFLAEFIARQFAYEGCNFGCTIARLGGLPIADDGSSNTCWRQRWPCTVGDFVAHAVNAVVAEREGSESSGSAGLRGPGDGVGMPPHLFDPSHRRYERAHWLGTTTAAPSHASRSSAPDTVSLWDGDWSSATQMARPGKSQPSSIERPRVLVTGALGMMGPDVASALIRTETFDVTLSDVTNQPEKRDSAQIQRTNTGNAGTPAPDPSAVIPEAATTIDLDVADNEQVRQAARQVDMIVNLAVVREHPKLCWDVNCKGTLCAIRAAVEYGHERFVNTTPIGSLAGHHMEYHHDLREDMAPQPGLWLYLLSKAVGHEITRVYSKNHRIHVLRCMVSGFIDPSNRSETSSYAMRAATTTFSDAALGVRDSCTVQLSRLPSRCESFFLIVPHSNVFRSGKAQKLLGWQPQHLLEHFYTLRRDGPASSSRL